MLYLSLTSAISWGVADFSGGLATRQVSAKQVVVISQVIGGLLLGIIALLWGEPIPGGEDLLIGASAGLFGAVGLLALYRGLADGKMGVFAPLSAVLTTFFPLLISLIVDGLPTINQAVGFTVGLVGIWLISFSGEDERLGKKDLLQAFLAGTGFGMFFVLVDQLNPGALFWPLVAARVSSISLLSMAALGELAWQRKRWFWPARASLLPILSAGIFDAGGNVLFAMATQAGRLDLAALFGSFYPGTTVLLAWIFLGERLSRRQWLGVLAALLAVALITI